MTYSSGGLIQATDYNGFVSTTAGANINDVWGTGSGDKGWGQTALATTSAASTVTATQWAQLVNTMSTAGTQTGTTLTARSAPTAGTVINVLAAVDTDLTNITTNRGNAVGVSAASGTWSGSTAKTTATGTGGVLWSIQWTHTVTFPSADQARYFWNAGGLVVLDMSKTSTGFDNDPDWNTFIGTIGTLYMSGRVNSANQQINGSTWTGFTRIGGTGTPSPNLTTTGWYSLTAGAAATTMWQLNNTTSPYTGDFVRITAAKNAGATTLTFVTTWYSAGDANPGASANISGGTDTASGGGFGTAPAVRCRFVSPSVTYLTNSWGTPTVAAAVA